MFLKFKRLEKGKETEYFVSWKTIKTAAAYKVSENGIEELRIKLNFTDETSVVLDGESAKQAYSQIRKKLLN